VRNRTIFSCCIAALLFQGAWSQTPPKPAAPKPYDQVITQTAKSSPGIFTIHRVDEKLYYEIPKNQLNKDFLMVVQIAKGRLGTGNGGGDPIDERVVRWTLRDNKVLLVDVDYRAWADPSLPIARAVAAANNPTYLAAFPLEAKGKADSSVIDVTKLFTTEVLEFSPKNYIGAKALDKDRCFLENALAFPENIEVESTLTLMNPDRVMGWGGGKLSQGTASLRMRYSMVKLPDQPMMPRLQDSRVGYFAHGQRDFGRPEHYAKNRYYIARWRLEKKDPNAPLSEPIKPIIFYIDPATPKAWVPYVKKGVEQWQVAFEEAGFKNAIQALEAPTKDPNWSMEDSRHSVIRWVASTVPNAYGPHISDPRSGEILEADIHMFHNILDLQRRWYFSQVGHLDPRARSLPLPDDLMGELVEFVVAHEVGHSLGLPHNMRASSTYPLEKVRDREWVKKMGHCPSIMDYCRFNYVAQPEDRIDLQDLIPKVGPYDKFSIMWGYKPIAGATTPDAENSTLDQWARQQDQVPWYRFSNMDLYAMDPGDQTEAVGDADPVAATRLGLKNLRRVHSMLVNATSQYGEPYEDLLHFRNQVYGQWSTEIRHVFPLVGGVIRHNKHAGQAGLLFSVVPKKRQQEAVDFLLQEAFQPQDWMLDKEVVGRISAAGLADGIGTNQQWLLSSLLSESRLNRMAEQMITHPAQAYSPMAFLDRTRASFFRELAEGKAISHPRRSLQRSWVTVLSDLTYRSGEARGMAILQLKTLKGELLAAQKRISDGDSKAHLVQLLSDIQRELDPRSSGLKRGTRSLQTVPEQQACPGCWHNSQLDWLQD